MCRHWGLSSGGSVCAGLPGGSAGARVAAEASGATVPVDAVTRWRDAITAGPTVATVNTGLGPIATTATLAAPNPDPSGGDRKSVAAFSARTAHGQPAVSAAPARTPLGYIDITDGGGGDTAIATAAANSVGGGPSCAPRAGCR